ncbi:thiol:disulfide interchange protein [Kordiimonas sediminis]|uniref:Thiol:disulfide interchange protein n=1 Tax=Kordiimonas sediminis TaxID=1735581 RepID=A0A919AVC4_9PROT|nr:protein-disulfide reductase DsbD domain-containing protein [Kordiimonas sediminis]GHF27854.1 thiol:disulfide interchange protein [Kordiimonas sediminis]
MQASTVEYADTHSDIELIAEVSSAQPGQTFTLAVTFTPKEHWHTYWKNPGDSGAHPIYEWQPQDGITIGSPDFPAPERLPVGPLMNYGYSGSATHLLPITISPDFSGGSIVLSGGIEWLVCEIECVPQYKDVSLEIPVGDGAVDVSVTETFTQARAAMPDPSYYDTELSLDDSGVTLKVMMAPSETATLVDAYYFPAQEGVLSYAAPQTLTIQEDGTVTLQSSRSNGSPLPDSGAGVLKLFYSDDTQQSFTIEPKFTAPTLNTDNSPVTSSTPALNVPELPLWQALMFALVGGLILNLMPCVFPILSLKAFAFIKTGDHSIAERRAEGWSYTAGIMISFLLIVGLLFVLRAAGASIGWGFQLQEPGFVALMTLIMVLISASLLGLFNIQTGLEGAGQGLTSQSGNKGAFFTGVLATLVATPCTAPLMAPAIGYALTQPFFVVILVFMAMAFGLALPFLLLSHSNTIAQKLPRPGPWMETVKQGMAFPMLLTAAWLIFIFTQQSDSAALFILLAAIVGVIFAVWLWQQGRSKALKVIALTIGIFCTAAIIWQPRSTETETESTDTLSYSVNNLQDVLQSGDAVFVYFTADWCITCKVNEQVALFRDQTIDLFRENNIQLMKGDWTNRNKEIADLLASYGRAGVPLYLYYPAGSKEPVILPEVLTTGIIRDTIEGAGQ